MFKTGRGYSIRWSSAQVAVQENHGIDTPAAQATDAPRAGGTYADQPQFSGLQGAVSPNTLKAITVNPMKLTHMSPVQAAVLPLLPQLAEPYKPESEEDSSRRPVRDLLVKARTGTGKTVAFLVPAIEARLKAIHAFAENVGKDSGLKNDFTLRKRAERTFVHEHVGTLILSPTRELATQIANEAMKLTRHHEGFQVQLFVGGTPTCMTRVTPG